MMAKFLSHQYSIDIGKLSDTCFSQNTHSSGIQGNPGSEELGCLGTTHLPITNDIAANLTGK